MSETAVAKVPSEAISPCCVATAAAALWEASPGTTGGETRARCLPFPSIVMLRDGVTNIIMGSNDVQLEILHILHYF